MSAQVIPFPAQRIYRQEDRRDTDAVIGMVAAHYINALRKFEYTHGRTPRAKNVGEWAEFEGLVKAEELAATATVLPFRFSPRRTYPVVRDRTGMQAVDELIAAHLGLESAGALKGVEARFGAPYERLPEAQAQEALRWGIQAERGALAVRQFLKELEGRFLESLTEQLAPPKPARRRKQSPKSKAAKGGGADA